MRGQSISDVVVMHPHAPMRLMLRMILTDEGYVVTEAPTYIAVLRHLHTAPEPVVVVAGNWEPNYHAEAEFFGKIASDASLALRHRFVLFATIPEWLPDDLDAKLRSLQVPILRMPSHVSVLVEAVALTTGRPLVEDESAG
jgi:hypothetical protein